MADRRRRRAPSATGDARKRARRVVAPESEAPVATFAELSGGRFWTTRLADVYRRCVLPLGTVAATGLAAAPHEYEVDLPGTSAWMHTRWRRRPPDAGDVDAGLAGISRAFAARAAVAQAQADDARRRDLARQARMAEGRRTARRERESDARAAREAAAQQRHAARAAAIDAIPDPRQRDAARERHRLVEARERERQAAAAAAPDVDTRDPLRVGEEFRSYKVRMYPTAAQAQELRGWFAAARGAYNGMVSAVREGRQPATQKGVDALLRRRGDWPRAALRVEPKVRRRAAMEVVEALDAHTKKNAARAARHEPPVACDLAFRSFRATNTETVILEGRMLRAGSGRLNDTGPVREFVPLAARRPGAMDVDRVEAAVRRRKCAAVRFRSTLARHGPICIRDRAWLIDRLLRERYLLHEGRILWDKQRGHFHLIVRWKQSRPADPDPTGSTKRIVALDPGSRHFQTYYDPATGEHGELLAMYRAAPRGRPGAERPTVAQEIRDRAAALDRLRARLAEWRFHPPGQRSARAHHQWYRWGRGEITNRTYRRYLRQHNHQARRHLVRQWRRGHARLRAWRRDAHYAAANHLLRHWDVVVASSARFGQMCERRTRVFGRETAQQLLGWAHYEFRERLRSAAFRYPGRLVVETSEKGTTGTCPRCGVFEPRGAAEVIRCGAASCVDVAVDRDVNGARNNLLWAYTQADHWQRRTQALAALVAAAIMAPAVVLATASSACPALVGGTA